MRKPLIYLLIFVMLLSGVTPALAQSSNNARIADESSVQTVNPVVNNELAQTGVAEEEYIIKYKDITKGTEKLKKQLKKVRQESNRFSYITTKLSRKDAEALSKDSNVLYIEKDQPIFTASETVGYNLINLHVPEVHQEGNYGDSVKVAVLDTGISTQKDWNIAGGVSFVPAEPDYNDYNGHGTAVASVLAALPNDDGMLGVAPNIEMYAVKVLDRSGQGTYSQVIAALEWAVDNQMDIVSMSFAGLENSKLLKEAVDKAKEADILLVAAAGNGGMETGYPARYDSVLSVGALDAYNQLAAFSNHGKVDLVAPGVDIPATDLSGAITLQSGTSMAVPHVAGIAAFLKSQQSNHSEPSIRRQLLETAKRLGAYSQYGYGLVDGLSAIRYDVDPSPIVEEPNTDNTIIFEPGSIAEAGAAEGTSDPSMLDGIVNRASEDPPSANMLTALNNVNIKPDTAPFSIMDNQESVSTLSGGITLSNSDLYLPGRNGLSFTLSRSYSTDNAQLYDTDVERMIFCVAKVTFQATLYQELSSDKVYISARYPYPNQTGSRYVDPSNISTGVLNNITDAVNYANYLNSSGGKSWYYNWVGPDASGKYSRDVLVFPQQVNALVDFPVIDSSIPIWRTSALGKLDEEKRFPIGKGWNWDIPYIKTKQNKSYLSLPGKGTYELVGTNLKGYPWKDLTLSYNTSVTVNGLTSSLALRTISGGLTYYFSSGNLIQISDGYNNTIQFKYSNDTIYGNVLSSITDVIGNTITITYAADKVVLTNGDRTVTYNKSPQSRTNDLPPYNSIITETLQSVVDSQGRKTNYAYTTKDAVTTIYDNGTLPKGKNPYLLLSSISYPTGATTYYQYETTPITRAIGTGATNQAYRLTNRYDYASGTYNQKQFTYTNPQGVNTDVGSNYQSIDHFYTNVNDGLKTVTYDNKKVFIDDSTPAVFYINQTTEKSGNTQNQTSYVYDTVRKLPVPNDVTSVTTVNGIAASPVKTFTIYDDYGNIISYTDPAGTTTTYTTDVNHYINSALIPVDSGLYRYLELQRDSRSGRILKETVRENNASGPIRKQIQYLFLDPYGNVTFIRIEDDFGTIGVDVEYDSAYSYAYPTSQSILVRDIDGNLNKIKQTASYNKNTGLLQSYTDGMHQVTSYTYDKLGRITQVSFPGGSNRTWAYNDTRNMVSSKDETGNWVYTRWNPLGWRTETGTLGVSLDSSCYVLDGNTLCAKSYYGYDTNGRVNWSDDAVKHRTRFEYDAWGRLTKSITNVDNAESVTTYDDVNRTVTSQDPMKAYSLIQQNDILGRVIETRESGTSTNEKHSFSYNLLGQLKQQIDYPKAGVANYTTYQYDVLGRIISATLPAQTAETTQYQYSLAGNLIKTIYPDGNAVTYGYDAAGRRISKTEPGAAKEKTYYDANSNVIKTVDKNNVTVTYGYNNRNFLTTKVSPDETVSYQYDAAGRRTQMTDLSGTTKYAYKAGTGELQTVTFPDLKTMSYTYNLLGLRQTMTDPFGYTQNYVYDSRNRLQGVGPSSSNLDVTYSYRLNNQLQKVTRKNGVSTSYTYDGSRLDTMANGSTSYDYNYDGTGNITSLIENGVTSTFTYDGLNRVLTNSKNNESYTYDSRGNRSTMQADGLFFLDGAINVYDSQNRLKEATIDTGKKVSYSYNGDGLMVGRTENGVTSRYYYDNGLLVAEGTVNGTSTSLASRYLYGVDGVTMMQTGGANYYYLKNGHGDVTELRTSTGTLSNQYTYDIWGNVTSAQETVKNPLRYSGEYWDSSTNLQYLRARWYDPSLGRFINQDTYEGERTNPLSLNLYAYVSNNPLKYSDPSGNARELAGVDNYDSGPSLVDTGSSPRIFHYMVDGILQTAKVAGAVMEFTLVGDVITIFDPEASAFDKALAVAGFVPIGKVIDGTQIIIKLKKEEKVVELAFEKTAQNLDMVANVCNCFVGGTKVQTDEGEKNIEDIKVGDKVLSKSDETGEVEYREVVKLFQKQADEVYYVHIGDEVIETTGLHPFWLVEKGWTLVQDLKVGDLLVSSDGTKLEINKIEKASGQTTVYNFMVDGYHSYFVSNLGIWVHNCTIITAGNNFKDHFIRHKSILENALGTKYPKYKTHGGAFLSDIGKIIDDGTVSFVGKGTLKKGGEVLNIYRGNGMTVATKPNGEFVTLLESGAGMDLNIQFVP